MLKILLNGINGRMGNTIKNLSLSYDNLRVVCGVDHKASENSDVKTYTDDFVDKWSTPDNSEQNATESEEYQP